MVQINNPRMESFDCLPYMFFSLHRPPIESPLNALGPAPLEHHSRLWFKWRTSPIERSLPLWNEWSI